MFSSFTYIMLIITCEISAITSLESTAEKCEPVPKLDTIGPISVSKGTHGVCTFLGKIDGFKECRGSCESSDTYNQTLGEYEKTCRCCRLARYRLVTVNLTCEYGEKKEHAVATADQCSCKRCDDGPYPEKPSPKMKMKNIKY